MVNGKKKRGIGSQKRRGGVRKMSREQARGKGGGWRKGKKD